MQNVLKTALFASMAWICASANAQVAQQSMVCEGEPLQFALKNAPDTHTVWEYSPDQKSWSPSEMTNDKQTPAHTGMNGYYRASYWDVACNEYQYSPVQQLTVRPFAERLTLNWAAHSGSILLTTESGKSLKEVEYFINHEVVQGKAKGFYVPAEKLPAIIYARNPENCEQSPAQLITIPPGDAKCNVAGGTLSTSDATQNLCLTDGLKTIQLSVTGNVGAGRFVLVESNTLTLVASNTTGLFTLNSYPTGSYFAAHVSLTTAQEFAGITNPTQLPACHSISNLITVTTLAVNGGNITANGPTTLSAGGSLSFSVTGSTGPNTRWVLLNNLGTLVLNINTTGIFSFDGFSPGTYRVVHIAYGPGVNLSQVDPQNPQGCISASNIVFVTVLAPSACPTSVSFAYKGEPVSYGTVTSANGRCWLDRNLGATAVATNSFDIIAHGDLFQWGRRDDGHQNRNSPNINILSSTDQPTHGSFILAPNAPNDWRSPQNNNLWQGINGINNPCPTGFRLPTETEWETERISWSTNNVPGAFASPLKLTAAGFRSFNDGSVTTPTGGSIGSTTGNGRYWSSSVSGGNTFYLSMGTSSAFMTDFYRANGYSVRCIKDDAVILGSISTLNCTAAGSSGALTQGSAAIGVSSTLAYSGGNGGVHFGQTVASTGVIGLTATLAAGNFANGNGNLIYTISGTPASSGTASFAIQIGGQSCTLTRIVNPAAGSISALSCASANHFGTLTQGVAASGVSSSVPYSGGNGGAHSGQTATSTGVTGLIATLLPGNFVNGNGNLTYTITGTPSSSGTASFALSIGGQACILTRVVSPPPFVCGSTVTFTYKGQSVTYGTVTSGNGRCWLDRNLGATQVATSSTQVTARGDLFQWGRGDDGHQNRTSPVTFTLSNTDQPGHGDFILTPNSPFDWRSPQNNNLWQGADGINNPCPAGFRVPTEAEWNTEMFSWSSGNTAGAFGSPLKLTTAGFRLIFSGSIDDVNFSGNYWSSTVSGINARFLYFDFEGRSLFSDSRATGLSVRCIKD